VARNGGAREESIGSGAGAGASLPRCVAAGDDVDGSEFLVSQVTRWPGAGVGGGGSKGGEELGFLGARDPGARVGQVEHQLAHVGAVLGVEAESNKSGDISAAVGRGAGHKSARSVEVNGAGLAIILRGVVWEDDGNGLSIRDDRSVISGAGATVNGSSRHGCVGNSSGVGIAAGWAASDERSSLREESAAQDTGGDGNENVVGIHFGLSEYKIGWLVLEYCFVDC